MQFRIGSVYKNKLNDIDFMVVRQRYDHENDVVSIQFVNIINWIAFESHDGKLLASGDISLSSELHDNYQLVGPILDVLNAMEKEKRKKK